MVSNSNPFANPEVRKVDLALGNISNPFGIFQVSPLHSSGEGTLAQWLQTWGSPGKPISEMSADSLVAQEGKAQQNNVSNAPRVRAGKHLAKGPMGSYRRKDTGGISEDLAELWG